MRRGAQAIAFTKSRVAAELIYRYARERLERDARRRSRRPDRALPRRLSARGAARDRAPAVLGRAARRDLHQRARAGHRRGRARRGGAVGFPPTLASTWQQAGRAGRGRAPSLAVLVAYNETVDQYLMRHPEYFFGQLARGGGGRSRQSLLLAQQLACAAYELPLTADDAGALRRPGARRCSRRSGKTGRRARSTAARTGRRPTSRRREVNLRTISDDTYTIVDATRGERGDRHGGRDQRARAGLPRGDLPARGRDVLRPRARPGAEGRLRASRARSTTTRSRCSTRTSVYASCGANAASCAGRDCVLGEVDRTRGRPMAMKKIRFHSLDSIGYHPLELPRLTLDTVSLW